MKTALKVSTTNPTTGKTVTKTANYINSEATNAQLSNFAQGAYGGLSANTVDKVLRVDTYDITDAEQPQPLQIVFTAPEMLNSDTVLSTMLTYGNVPASVDKTILDFTYNSSDQQFTVAFKNNSNNTTYTKTFNLAQMPLGFDSTYFVFNDNGEIVERDDNLFGNGGFGHICDWLDITPEYFVSCIKGNKYLKFLATIFNGVTYNYSESEKSQTITYDDDSDSMIITAVNADIDHIYLALSQCKLLANRGAGTISDGVVQTAAGSTFNLVFEKSK